jgi:hypothetical protein
MTKERRPATRTIDGWARSVLLETGAIRECEEHGWMRDRTDPHARDRAFLIARNDPPLGVSAESAVAAIEDALRLDRQHLPRMPTRRPIASDAPGPLG